MPKKKVTTPGSPIGPVGAAVEGYEPPAVRDNNPDGPSNLPNHEFYAYRRDDLYGKRICFPCDIGKGESAQDGDAVTNTPDGVSRSRGENGQQYNWGEGQSGKWNENEDWKGGNLTGN